jgi:PAS domain S-box-containing protein
MRLVCRQFINENSEMSFNTKLNFGFALALIVLVTVSVLSYSSTLAVNVSGKNREFERETLFTIETTLSTLKDAETGQRGYLLTGNKDYLEPYLAARQSLDLMILSLRDYFKGDPEQIQVLDQVEPLINDKMQELAETIVLRKTQGLQAALKLVNTNRGQNSMELVRLLVSDMIRHQNVRAVDHISLEQKAFKKTIYLIIGGSVGAVFLVLLSGFFVNFDYLRRRRLEQERGKFASLIQNSSDFIAIASLEGEVEFVNDAGRTLVGLDKVRGEQHTVIADFFTEMDYLQVVREIIPESISRGNWMGEISLKNLDTGALVPVIMNAFPIRDSFGNVIGLATVSRDISDRKRIEAELIAAREIALEAARLKAEFLANMSHEIRTPLNGIIGMTDLLIETQLSDLQRRYAKIVQDSGLGLLTIINDILDFSKIEAGKMDLEVIDFNIQAVVEGQAELLAPKAREKELSLMTFIEPKISGSLRGDPGRIAQVLLNLASNAIKFTAKGSVVIHAAIESENASGMMVRFKIQDTGTGISVENQKRLFQPFTQADGSMARKYGGTGLGLSISKRLVEIMGGTIGLTSNEGEGSTFWFTLPLAKVAVETKGNLNSGMPAVNGLKILVVDDDPLAGEIISAYLKAWKMNSTQTSSAEEALSILRLAAEQGRPFDLAVVDKRMPIMDGFAFCEQIKADPKISSTRLILMTAYDRAVYAEAALKIGFSTYLSKPVKQSDLFDGISKTMFGQTKHEAVNSAHVLIPRFTSSKRILIAEDNPVNQMLVLTQLKGLGLSAHAVANGREAVEALRSAHFDLVLMDCQMPEMDGYEATRAIREVEKSTGEHVVIIALTANAMKEDQDKCMLSGMDGYLSKPIKKNVLASCVAQWLKLDANSA